MAKKLIIVDSCVFIQAFRKNDRAKNDLKDIDGFISYTVITQLELLAGANTFLKKEAVLRIFETYYGIPLTFEISQKAIQLMQEYVSGQQVLSVPDCLIAATSIITGFPLLTYNRKDFAFIKELDLYQA
jgi:predicted nucleic acid-binding protein